MKKFLLFGLSIFAVLLSLTLVINGKVVAQTPAPTNTPTLELIDMFPTKTPVTAGSCPAACANEDDVTWGWANTCSDCICTKTPAYPSITPNPTLTPAGFVATSTPIPSTPTTTPNPLNVTSIRYWLSSTLTDSNILEEVEYQYGVENVNSCAFTANYWQISGSVQGAEYTEGFTVVTEAGMWGYLQTYPYYQLTLYVTNNTSSQVVVHFYGGTLNGQETIINPNTPTSIILYRENWTTGQPPTKRWRYETVFFDITVKSSSGSNTGTGYTSKDVTFRINSNNSYCTSTNQSTRLEAYTWHPGGTYAEETFPGVCNVPEEKGGGGTEYFDKFGGYWIGQGVCINVNDVIAVMGNEYFQTNMPEGYEAPEAVGLNLCFREFYLLPTKIFGVGVDFNMMLYGMVGIFLFKKIAGML